MFVLVYAPHLCYHVHMKRHQIRPNPILLSAPEIILGGFILVCVLACVWMLIQEIAFLFAV